MGRFLCLLLLSSVSFACNSAPEPVAVRCVEALCQGEESVLRSCLTDESLRLYHGLRGVLPQRFSCMPADEVTAFSREIDPEAKLTRVMLTDPKGHSQTVIMQHREGAWRLDLFMIGWDDTVGRSEAFPAGARQ